MLDEIKKDYKGFISNWKNIHMKDRHRCNLSELYKKLDTAKKLSWSFTISTVILLAIILELFIANKVSITFNTLLIMCMVALYDEMRNVNNLKLFIYFKERETNGKYDIDIIATGLRDKENERKRA